MKFFKRLTCKHELLVVDNSIKKTFICVKCGKSKTLWSSDSSSYLAKRIVKGDTLHPANSVSEFIEYECNHSYKYLGYGKRFVDELASSGTGFLDSFSWCKCDKCGKNKMFRNGFIFRNRMFDV